MSKAFKEPQGFSLKRRHKDIRKRELGIILDKVGSGKVGVFNLDRHSHILHASRVQFVLPVYSCLQGHVLEHGQHPGAMPLKKTYSSVPGSHNYL